MSQVVTFHKSYSKRIKIRRPLTNLRGTVNWESPKLKIQTLKKAKKKICSSRCSLKTLQHRYCIWNMKQIERHALHSKLVKQKKLDWWKKRNLQKKLGWEKRLSKQRKQDSRKRLDWRRKQSLPRMPELLRKPNLPKKPSSRKRQDLPNKRVLKKRQRKLKRPN